MREYFEHVPEGTPGMDPSFVSQKPEKKKFYLSLEALNPPDGCSLKDWIEILGNEAGELLPVDGKEVGGGGIIAEEEAHEAKTQA